MQPPLIESNTLASVEKHENVDKNEQTWLREGGFHQKREIASFNHTINQWLH